MSPLITKSVFVFIYKSKYWPFRSIYSEKYLYLSSVLVITDKRLSVAWATTTSCAGCKWVFEHLAACARLSSRNCTCNPRRSSWQVCQSKWASIRKSPRPVCRVYELAWMSDRLECCNGLSPFLAETLPCVRERRTLAFLVLAWRTCRRMKPCTLSYALNPFCSRLTFLSGQFWSASPHFRILYLLRASKRQYLTS